MSEYFETYEDGYKVGVDDYKEKVKEILTRPLVTDGSQDSMLRCRIIKEYRSSILKELGDD
jgi:hypothetical protein